MNASIRSLPRAVPHFSTHHALRLELTSITSASGAVTVANADNGLPGAGATWDYSTKVGSDGALTANELSVALNIRFNNPINEAFTVTLNVVGNLPRRSFGGSSSSTGGSTGANTTGGSSGTGPSGTPAVFQLIYNPLLKKVSVQLLKP